jgi:hypothetical protein
MDLFASPSVKSSQMFWSSLDSVLRLPLDRGGTAGNQLRERESKISRRGPNNPVFTTIICGVE